MKNKYRIVTDEYCGYAVQIKRWWFPFWMQLGFNTFFSQKKAESFALNHSKNRVVAVLDSEKCEK